MPTLHRPRVRRFGQASQARSAQAAQQFREAGRLLRKAERVIDHRELFGAGDPHARHKLRAVTLNNLGCYHRRCALHQADLCHFCLRCRTRLMSPEPGAVTRSLSRCRSGRLHSALKYLEQAAAVEEGLQQAQPGAALPMDADTDHSAEVGLRQHPACRRRAARALATFQYCRARAWED